MEPEKLMILLVRLGWLLGYDFGPLATHRGVPVPSCKEAPAGGVAGRWGPASLAGCDV